MCVVNIDNGGAVTLLNSLSMVTKYNTPPCCRANYACYVKQNRRSKYSNEHGRSNRLVLLDS